SRSKPEGRVEVVVFRNPDDFRTFSDYSSWEAFQRESAGKQFVVTHTPVPLSLMGHEIMHRLIRHYLWRAPLWLNEGLAEFYSNLSFRGDHVRFGLFPDRWVSEKKFPPLERLLNAAPNEFYDDQSGKDYYAAAQLFVHMLNTEQPEYRRRFRAYIAALRD